MADPIEMETEKDIPKRKLSMEGDGHSLHSSEETLDEMNDALEENSGGNHEEIEISDHLRQFDVLDEVQGDDSGSENGDNENKGKPKIVQFFFNSII